MRTFKIIMILLISLAAISCNPDYFFMNSASSKIINAYKINGIKAAKQIGENSFELYENGIVSLRVPELTQFVAEMDIKFSKGIDLNLYLRTTPNDFAINRPIIINFAENYASLLIDDNLIERKAGLFSENKFSRLSIQNFSDDIIVLLDCDTLFNFRTQNINSEYIIMESKKSELTINGIIFEHIK